MYLVWSPVGMNVPPHFVFSACWRTYLIVWIVVSIGNRPKGRMKVCKVPKILWVR
jgi:hypothetical protein